MKKKNMLIISLGLLLLLALAWTVLSLNEFYEEGQELSLWFYFKKINTDKLEGLIPFLIPAAVMPIYELNIIKRKKSSNQ